MIEPIETTWLSSDHKDIWISCLNKIKKPKKEEDVDADVRKRRIQESNIKES